MRSVVLPRYAGASESDAIAYDSCYSNYADDKDIVTTSMVVDGSPPHSTTPDKQSVVKGYYCNVGLGSEIYHYLTEPLTNSFIQIDLGSSYSVRAVKVAHRPGGAFMDTCDVYVGSSLTISANTQLPRVESFLMSATYAAPSAVQGQYVQFFSPNARIDAGEIQVIV